MSNEENKDTNEKNKDTLTLADQEAAAHIAPATEQEGAIR